MIVSVGSTYFDQFIQVKRLPKRGRSTVVLDRYEHPGGYAANAVSWIAQLCELVFFYTALARDIHGKQLQSYLEGLESVRLVAEAIEHTPISTILVDENGDAPSAGIKPPG